MSENMQSCSSCGELVPIEYVVCVWCGFDLTAEHIRRAGIIIGRNESIQRMKKVVRDPMNASKELALIPDLTGGKLILYMIAFVMTLNMLVVFGKLDGTDFNATDAGLSIALFKNSDPLFISFKFIVGMAFIFVQPIVLYIIFMIFWKFSTKILKIFIKSVGGFADDEKIKCIIGYSMLPVLFGWSLSLFFTLFAGDVNISGNVTYNTISAAVVEVTRTGVGMVGFFFIIIGWLWTVGLMVILMRHSAKLSLVESIIAVGIPTLFMMIVVVFGTSFF